MEKAVLAAARVDHLAWDVPVQAERVLVNRYPTGNQNFGRSRLCRNRIRKSKDFLAAFFEALQHCHAFAPLKAQHCPNFSFSHHFANRWCNLRFVLKTFVKVSSRAKTNLISKRKTRLFKIFRFFTFPPKFHGFLTELRES